MLNRSVTMLCIAVSLLGCGDLDVDEDLVVVPPKLDAPWQTLGPVERDAGSMDERSDVTPQDPIVDEPIADEEEGAAWCEADVPEYGSELWIEVRAPGRYRNQVFPKWAVSNGQTILVEAASGLTYEGHGYRFLDAATLREVASVDLLGEISTLARATATLAPETLPDGRFLTISLRRGSAGVREVVRRIFGPEGELQDEAALHLEGGAVPDAISGLGYLSLAGHVAHAGGSVLLLHDYWPGEDTSTHIVELDHGFAITRTPIQLPFYIVPSSLAVDGRYLRIAAAEGESPQKLRRVDVDLLEGTFDDVSQVLPEVIHHTLFAGGGLVVASHARRRYADETLRRFMRFYANGTGLAEPTSYLSLGQGRFTGNLARRDAMGTEVAITSVDISTHVGLRELRVFETSTLESMVVNRYYHPAGAQHLLASRGTYAVFGTRLDLDAGTYDNLRWTLTPFCDEP